MATQRKYGVPASVTIAQAIDESGWGQSTWRPGTTTCSASRARARQAATRSRRQEYQNGQLVTSTASFRVYHSLAESINDHGKLLATSGHYRRPWLTGGTRTSSRRR